MKKGFTLVELAVTLAVIIVLMSVSVPIYKSNMSKYKEAEGYALLASIRSAQERYYLEYGNFLSNKDGSAKDEKKLVTDEIVLSINARTNKYYTIFSINGYDLGGSTYWYPTGGDAYKIYYAFGACAKGNNGVLRMNYNLTSGVTIFK
ncbi:MAG: type II secretion system protein [Elusimicrobia bacterium]|nr:type II secretion system protein [Elusimicrobiota bacterium]